MAMLEIDYDQALTLTALVKIEMQTAERLGGQHTKSDYLKDLKVLAVKLDNARMEARDNAKG